jgi:glutamyl-tRNA synthetase
VPEYAHLPLAVGPDGGRLAKRAGAISLARLVSDGWTVPRVVAWLARSLGLDVGAEAAAADLVAAFDWDRVPRAEWVVTVPACA